MSDLDPFDRELRSRLGADLTTSAEPEAALAALRPRFRRARTRRVAAYSTSAAVAVVLIVLGVSYPGGQTVHVVSPAHGVTASTSTTSLPTVPSTAVAGGSTGPASTVTTVPPVTVPSRGPATSVGGGPGQSVPATTVPPTGSVTTTTEDAVRSVPVTSVGGSVVLRVDSTVVHVFSMSPAPGWSVVRSEQPDPTRIEVRFGRDGSSEETRIEARVDHGQLQTKVS